jgi:hypothetical protein
MPRKAPKEVIEHRITLGDYERKMIAKQLAEDDTIKKVKAGAEIGKTVIIGGAVVGVGILATTAYREAQGLVDVVTDTPASLWKMTQYRLGLISFQDLIGDLNEDAQERQEAKDARKNQGILEWGFDWIMKFLLGEDMIWTKATDTTTSNGTNLSPYQQKQNESGFVENLEASRSRWQEFWIHFHGNLDDYTDEGAYNLYMGISP